jgi:hypothetical protein
VVSIAEKRVGKLDDATREGLRKYQQAEGLKITGTLNKITLEKMNIALTESKSRCESGVQNDAAAAMIIHCRR